MLSFQEDWWLVVSLPANETTFTDWPGAEGVEAIYQVVTTVDGGQSDPVYAYVWVPVSPPYPPIDSKATATTF
jgi:hypothetical protein